MAPGQKDGEEGEGESEEMTMEEMQEMMEQVRRQEKDMEARGDAATRRPCQKHHHPLRWPLNSRWRLCCMRPVSSRCLRTCVD